MIAPTASQALALADTSGWQSCVAKTRDERGEDGQFFTPLAIARSLAGWFQPAGFNRASLHLLDPGAGGGVLTAAVVDRLVTLRTSGALPRLQTVTIEVWELDHTFLPTLRQNLSVCAESLRRIGIQTTVHINHGNYIDGAALMLDSGLFGSSSVPQVTHAIINPPYRKIAASSHERSMLASVGIETSNLYAAFVWLALRHLAKGGELAAITPRSFCNGPYFREFRRELLSKATFNRIHVFHSRTEAFSRDNVLQENILFLLQRGSPNNNHLTVSTGSLDAPVQVCVPRCRFVSPTDADQIMHITTESDASDVRSFFDSLPCKLFDLGMEVSTGPVVDFRLKDSLAYRLETDGIPLVYPHCVTIGQVRPPLHRAANYGDARSSRKPVAIRDNEETRKWLIPTARFVLIKRFSSKEEKRRLVAGVLDPAAFPSALIGIENHLNFFHRKRAGLPASLARGLCRFLNSTVADRYFRQFNGHTQVNASDLRSLRYPDITALEQLGATTLDDASQSAIDLAMTAHLGAPSFSES